MGRGNCYIELSRFCTVNCGPSVRNYPLSHIRFGPLTSELGGKCVTTAPLWPLQLEVNVDTQLLCENYQTFAQSEYSVLL